MKEKQTPKIYVNRILNLKKIKAIGLDMDHTIVRYKSHEFEKLAHHLAIKNLYERKEYPKIIKKLEFDPTIAIQGLVIDKKRGHILQLSRYGKVKIGYQGLRRMDYRELHKVYSSRIIDLSDPDIQSLDTSFSHSQGVLYSQLVDLKMKGEDLPDFRDIANDVLEAIDIAHRDGSLKGKVKENLENFIHIDSQVAELLEKLKKHQKKLLLITNSDYSYTKAILDKCITPYLKNHKDWVELFDISITFASKPNFFTRKDRFLRIDPQTGMMSNFDGPITPGVYQGGWAGKLQKQLGLDGEEILYIGDHIYGDVVSIKKTFNWRTALVLEPLEDEVRVIQEFRHIEKKIDELSQEKLALEVELHRGDRKFDDPDTTNDLYSKIILLNNQISDLVDEYHIKFNPYWGQMMRAGIEESRFADQVQKYACIYMSKLTDLLTCSPKTYFRPMKRVLPHEL